MFFTTKKSKLFLFCFSFAFLRVTAFTISQIVEKGPVSKPIIACGDNEDSVVNITYTGDNIFVMYPVDHFLDCASEKVDALNQVIYNVKQRDCGMEYNNRTNTWSINVLMQKMDSLVTAMDPIYTLTCIYNKWLTASEEAEVVYPYTNQNLEDTIEKNIKIDPVAVRTLVKETLSEILKDSYTMMLQVLDANHYPTQNIYTGKVIILSLTFQSAVASLYSLPAVTQCYITDNTSQSQASFQDEFIAKGCGNGKTLSSNQGFIMDDVIGSFLLKFHTPEILVPSSWTKADRVVFVCHVAVCQKDLTCGNTCPLDVEQFDKEPDRTVRVKIKSPVLTTAADEVGKPVTVQTSGTVWDDSKWIQLNWPYLVIIAILILVLIMFGCIMLYVVRTVVHCKKCHKCYKNQPPTQHNNPPLRRWPASVSTKQYGQPDSRQSGFSRPDSGLEESYNSYFSGDESQRNLQKYYGMSNDSTASVSSLPMGGVRSPERVHATNTRRAYSMYDPSNRTPSRRNASQMN